jgi:hypothetical protein
MKKNWIPLVLAAAAAAGNGAEKSDPDLIVIVHAANLAPQSIPLAEGQAKRMLASVGIAAEFHVGKPNYQGRAEVIEAVFTTQRDESFKPGVLAFAILGQESGPRIEILYDRIVGCHRDSWAVPALAHVLVHEITHILEGVNRHSESGVMKAHWDPGDWNRMSSASFPFADEDIRLIHGWVEHHRQTLTAWR